MRRDVSWREVDGEILALDPDFTMYVSTNETGTLIWKALVAGASSEEIAHRLADEFGIDADRARTDVDAFVADLDANGFLDA
jgi:hypothetical protein